MNHASRVATLEPVLKLLLASPGRYWLSGLALAVLTVWMGIGLLGLSGWFITATALASLQAAAAIGFDVFMPSAGIRLLALGRTFSRYGERVLLHDATLAQLSRLREQVFRGWAQRVSARALMLRPARLLFRITSDIDALESLHLRILVPALAALGAALLAGLLVGAQSATLGLGLAAWLLLGGWGALIGTGRRACKPSAQRAAAFERLRTRMADLVAGQAELLMAGRLRGQCEAVVAADARLADADLRLNRLETCTLLINGVVSAGALAGMLVASAWLVERGDVGAPVAALMVLATLAATETLAALRRGALEAGRLWLAVRRIGPAVVPAPSETLPTLPEAGVAARIVNARVHYAGAARATLPGLSLQLVQGERVALIGPSGAGKSSVLALIAGEIAAASGQVQAQPVGWLTQRIDLFQDSLRDNLRLAAPDASDSRLWAALADAGLAADLHALRDGLDTSLGEGGLGLSGGQARRLALARLFLQDRPLWLMDEATEAMDAQTAQDLLARLRQRADGRTLLMATHQRREAALADRLLRIERGWVVQTLQRGTPEFITALAALRAD